MIFETHAHYDDERFDEDRDILIEKLFQKNICNIINVGASIESTKTNDRTWQKNMKICMQPQVYTQATLQG